jgi:RNA polymerase sigma factor (sigma-70 family)
VDADEIVVRQVLAGDKTAFGELIDRHRAEALLLARRLVRASHEAEDVVQEALLRAFLSLDRLRAADRFRGWLLGIVVNIARSRRRVPLAYSLEDVAGGRLIHDAALLDPMPSPEVVQESLELHRLVDEAIAALPSEQRTTVQLHYVEGLKLWEIASLLGSPLGTIKARLHRARAQLRQALIDTMVVTASRPAIAMEESPMVEVTLEDVVVRAPKHEEARWLAEGKDYKLGGIRVLLLKERAGDRVLPIWVGALEGDAIALRLVGLAYGRPMPWDLMMRLLDVGTMQLEKVMVHSLRQNVFIGSLSVRTGATRHEIDARPSDAITLALDAGAPIFVTEEVFNDPQVCVLRAGAEMTGLDARHARALNEGKAESEPVEKEWCSFRALPRHESTHVRQRVK